MTDDIDILSKRWIAIEAEVLSVIRQQLSIGTFNINVVQNRLNKACDEWFDGSLAPAIWYNDLSKKDAIKAETFKKYVKQMNLTEVQFQRPSKLYAKILTTLSIPLALVLLYLLKEKCSIEWLKFPFYVIIILSIAIGVLTWTIFELKLNKKQSDHIENIICAYQKQLRIFGENLKQIILL